MTEDTAAGNAVEPFTADTCVAPGTSAADAVGYAEIEDELRAAARLVVATARDGGVAERKTDATDGRVRASAYLVAANIAIRLAATADPRNELAWTLLDVWDAVAQVSAEERAQVAANGS